MQSMAMDRDSFQVDPGAAYCFEAIAESASAKPPTWFALDDGAALLDGCMDGSDAEHSWNSAIFSGATRILLSTKEIQPLLQPEKGPDFLSANEAAPPVSTVRTEELDETVELARKIEAEFDSEEGKSAVADDLRSSVRRASAQISEAQATQDEERQISAVRKALTKLTFIVGSISAAVTGGVVVNLLSAPDAATTLALRLQPLLDALLRIFY